MTVEIKQIQVRDDTTANWASFNPILVLGEIGYDSDLKRIKIGDGIRSWSALGWATMATDEVAAVLAASESINAGIDTTDGAFATVLANPASESATALSAAFVSVGRASRQRPANTIVLIGDSLTAYNGYTSIATPPQSSGPQGTDAKGMHAWAEVFLGADLRVLGNAGIGGQETGQIRSRFETDVIAYDPAIVSILAGTNNEPEDDTTGDLQWMYERALSDGMLVLAHTIPPSAAGSSYPADKEADRQLTNQWIRAYCAATPGMILADIAAVWQDPAQAGFKVLAAYVHDGVHPSMPGAQAAGRVIAEALRPFVPRNRVRASVAGAPFNLLSNPLFLGSGSGDPSGWNSTGSGLTKSYAARTDGFAGQDFVIVVPTDGSFGLTSNVSVDGLNLSVGDFYDFYIEVEIEGHQAKSATQRFVRGSVQQWDGSTFSDRIDMLYRDGGARYGVGAPLPDGVYGFRTTPKAVTSGKTLIQVGVDASGGGTYRIRGASVRNLSMIEDGVTAPENVPHTNIVPNGTFETNTTGWGGNLATIARTTSQFVEGVASLQITHAADANSDARTDRLTIDPLIPLYYSLWVYAPSGHAGTLRFTWFATTSGGYVSITNVNFTGTGGWQKIIAAIPASTLPDTAFAVQFAVSRGDGVGTPVVYVDQVDLWQV